MVWPVTTEPFFAVRILIFAKRIIFLNGLSFLPLFGKIHYITTKVLKIRQIKNRHDERRFSIDFEVLSALEQEIVPFGDFFRL